MVNLLGAIGAGATVSIVIKGVDKFSGTFSKANKGLNLLKTTAKVGIGAFAGAGVALGAIGAASIKAAGDFEQTQIAFTTMLGSAEEAEIMLKNLADFAKRTPFTLTGIEEQSKKLLAYGISAENLMGDIKALGDISAGVGTEKLPQLTLAFGQVAAAGKLRGQEIRQFTEAGVPILEELGKVMGKTAGEIQEMTSRGEIGFEDVRKAMMSLSGEGGRFEDLMTKQSETVQGKFSNLQDTLQLMAREIGATILPTVAKLADLFLEEVLPAIQPLIPVLGEFIAQIITKLTPYLPKIVEMLTRFFDIAMRLFDALSPLIDPIMQIALAIGNALLESADELIPAIKEIVDAFVILLPEIVPIIPAIGKLAVSLVKLINAALIPLVPAIQAILPVLEVLIFFFNQGLDAISALVGWIKDLVKWIGKINLGIIEAASDFVGGTFGKLGNVIGVNDAIIRPNGDIIKTHPKDTLIATKNPENFGNGITLIVQGDMIGLDADDVSRRLANELNTKMSL